MRRLIFAIVVGFALMSPVSCTPPNFPVVLRDVSSVLSTVDTVLATAERIWALVSPSIPDAQKADTKAYTQLVSDIRAAARQLQRVSDGIAKGETTQDDLDEAYNDLKALVRSLQNLLERYHLTGGSSTIESDYEALGLQVGKLLGELHLIVSGCSDTSPTSPIRPISQPRTFSPTSPMH